MDLMSVLVYVLGGFFVLLGVIVGVHRIIRNNAPAKNSKSVQLQINALERCLLLIERTALPTIVRKQNLSESTVASLRNSVIIQMRAELEHNTTQQLYISEKIWTNLNQIIEQDIAYINQQTEQAKQDLSAVQFVQQLVFGYPAILQDHRKQLIATIKASVHHILK